MQCQGHYSQILCKQRCVCCSAFQTGLVRAALVGQREWSTRLLCAARCVLVAWCQRQPRRGVRGSLMFLEKGPHSPGGPARGPCLPLQPPCTSTFICGRRGAPLARCSELPWASAGPPPTACIPFILRASLQFSPKQPDLVHSSLPKGGTHRELQLCQRASGCAQPRRLVSHPATAQCWVQEIRAASSLPRIDLRIGSG